jgi:hypothetical protein
MSDKPNFNASRLGNLRDQGFPIATDLESGPAQMFYEVILNDYREGRYAWDSSQGRALRDFAKITRMPADPQLMKSAEMQIESQAKADASYAGAMGMIKKLARRCLDDAASVTVLTIKTDELLGALWPHEVAEEVTKSRPLSR